MKIPKTLRAFGYDWKVRFKNSKKDKESSTGGAFKWREKIIEVDVGYNEQENIFIHELLEAILMELGYRFYGQEKSMEYQFHFDHSGFVRVHSMFYQILKDNKMI